MSTLHELADQNLQAAEAVGAHELALNPHAAELVLRNLYVANDRLGAHGFSKLSPETTDRVTDTVRALDGTIAKNPADYERQRGETDAEYEFRTKVQLPIVSAQQAISVGNFKRGDSHIEDKIKMGVRLSAMAFSGIVKDAGDHPTLKRDEGYFRGNTSAASRIISRSHS